MKATPRQKTRLTIGGVENKEYDLSAFTDNMKDKAKGDAIVKGLVVLQTGWFAVQFAARIAQGLFRDGTGTHHIGAHFFCLRHILFLVE